MKCVRLKDCVDAQLTGKIVSKCCNDSSKCIESSDRRPEVKCEEKGKKYILLNTEKNHVISYKMDGGVIVVDKTVPEGTGKCDYMYVVSGAKKKVILTELKGVDVTKALKQLNGTLVIYENFFKEFDHVYGRIVMTSSVPRLNATSEYTKLNVLLRKKYQGNVKIAEKKLSEKDVELAN